MLAEQLERPLMQSTISYNTRAKIDKKRASNHCIPFCT